VVPGISPCVCKGQVHVENLLIEHLFHGIEISNLVFDAYVWYFLLCAFVGRGCIRDFYVGISGS
jgi:hypothetical protein